MERKIVIVAPTFNEEENIASFLAALPPKYDVVVSDSHSKDKTAQIVKKIATKNHHVHYLDVQRRGLGLGLYQGLDYAARKLKADILVTMEADLSNDPKQLPQFLAKLKTADLVVGSRYTHGGAIINWSWWRKFLSRVANLTMMAVALTPNIHEFTNLYRAFTKETWEKIRPKMEVRSGWLFVPAFVFEALGENLKIVEQPITYFDRFGGRSKMNTVRYTRNLLVYAIKYRLRKSASFLKFLVVGTLGFIINTTVLILGVRIGMTPANAGAAGAELAIVSNFIWNNFWTFSERRLTSWGEVPVKFLQFNLLSLGSVIIQYICLKVGEIIFGLTKYKTSIINAPVVQLITWYMLFYVAGVGLGLIWNYFMYSRVIWKKKHGETS